MSGQTNEGGLPQLQALSSSEVTLDWIMNSADPEYSLLNCINKLIEKKHSNKVSSIIFSYLSRRSIKNYWTLFVMMQFFQMEGQLRSAFFLGVLARRIEKSGPGSPHIANNLFRYLKSIGDQTGAAAIFQDHYLQYGEAVWDADEVYYTSQMSLPIFPYASIDQNIAIEIRPKSIRPGWTPWRIFGGKTPSAIADLVVSEQRDAVRVIPIDNGQLITSRGSCVVCDADGRPFDELGFGSSPDLILWRYRTVPELFESYDADDVVLISDKWWRPNICHFLLDHVPRLYVYEQAGVDIRSALVIGPDLEAPFQTEMVNEVGVTRYLGTTKSAVVRAKRMWIATDCRHLQLSAYLGSKWVHEYLRQTFSHPPNRRRRLIVSRKDSGRRQLVNEVDVIALLSRYGFELIALGDLSFSDQVQAFADATHIIGPHGAGMALIVFCHPGTHFAEIFGPWYSNAQIAMQAHENQIKYTAIVAQDRKDVTQTYEEPSNRQYADFVDDLESVIQWVQACEISGQ